MTESPHVPGTPYGLGMVVRRWYFEVYGQTGCRHPVGVTLRPRTGTQLRPDDRGEVVVAQGSCVGHPPAVPGLEVIREADEVVANRDSPNTSSGSDAIRTI